MGADEKMGLEIDAIDHLSRDELAARWTKIYGNTPPAIRRPILSYAVAWDMQAKRLGGYSAETRRRLKRAIARMDAQLNARTSTLLPSDLGSSDANVAAPSDRPPNVTSLPSVGARLIRVWNGHTNVVDVVDGGYLFEGEVHRSLSAIARKITNAHWSGPRFFGL